MATKKAAKKGAKKPKRPSLEQRNAANKAYNKGVAKRQGYVNKGKVGKGTGRNTNHGGGG